MTPKKTAYKAITLFIKHQAKKKSSLGDTARNSTGQHFQDYLTASYDGPNGKLQGAEINTTDNREGFGFSNRFNEPKVSYGPKKLTPGHYKQFLVADILKWES
jgi:hypothetical protein